MSTLLHREGAPAAGATSPARAARDPALDLLRGVALVRVVLWHTFAMSWMTVFAAIPLMFFVAGSLLAASGEQRSHLATVWRRCRRLLIPLWAYAAVVGIATLVRAVLNEHRLEPTATAFKAAVSWIL